MYKLILRRNVRKAFAALSRGDYEPVVRRFSPTGRFVFAGEHALGGERVGPDEVRDWFREMLGRFPGIRIEPVDVLVNGWPWRTNVASHLVITTTLPDGSPYRNEGMQLLRLRWGRVVEDLIFEDTLALDEVLRRFARREPTPVG